MNGRWEGGVVKPFELGRGEHHACCEDGPESGQIEERTWDYGVLLEFMEVAGRGTEVGDFLFGDDGEERCG
jgi:hypothetical protein